MAFPVYRIKRFIQDTEKISEEHTKAGTKGRFMPEYRWECFKFILLGIQNESEYKKAMDYVDDLMDMEGDADKNKKKRDEADTWLLRELAKVIEFYESATY